MFVNDSDRDWRWFGRTDPYYAVLAEERYHRDCLTPDVEARFFGTGEEHARRVLQIVREHLAPDFAPERALDFGCGVGRVTLALAHAAEHAVGVDVSEGMLEVARARAASRQIRNVEFALGDDALSRVGGTFDLIHSYIVFQHIPVVRGERLTRQLLGRLRPGGVAVLHYTYARRMPTHGRMLSWARRRVPLANGLLNLAKGRAFSAPVMQGNDYSLTRVFGILNDHGFRAVHVEFSDHGGVDGVLLFARRSGDDKF